MRKIIGLLALAFLVFSASPARANVVSTMDLNLTVVGDNPVCLVDGSGNPVTQPYDTGTLGMLVSVENCYSNPCLGVTECDADFVTPRNDFVRLDHASAAPTLACWPGASCNGGIQVQVNTSVAPLTVHAVFFTP